MSFTEQALDRLTQPINAGRVKSREGGRGTFLSYIEAHDAIRTANEIFGIGGWSYMTEDLTLLGIEPIVRDDRKGFRVGYSAVVRVTVNTSGLTPFPIVFSDVGYGDSQDYSGSQIAVHELAMKEAVSDGVKRALKNLGSQFGLDLYDKVAREDIEKRVKLGNSSPTKLKSEVMKIAKAKLEKDKPSAKEVAELFGVTPAALAEESTIREILQAEGLL